MKLFLLTALLFTTGMVSALEFRVNTTEDTLDIDQTDGLCSDANGMCSLRAAIMQTNAFATDDTIYLPRNTNYILSRLNSGIDNQQFNDLDIFDGLLLSIENPELPINGFEEMPIIGFDSAFGDRVIEISDGDIVTLQGLVIFGGNADISLTNTRRGGGLYVSDQVNRFELIDSIVFSNRAGFGAGVYSAADVTEIHRSDISYNTLLFPAAIILGAGGAGMFHVGNELLITASGIHHNYINEENGFLLSALTLNGVDANTSIVNSYISDNGVPFNTSESMIDGIGANGSNVKIINSNVTGNTRYGIRFSSMGKEELFIRNSVLANNGIANCNDLEGIINFGEPSAPAHILSSDLSCNLPELASNIEDTEARLSPLIAKFTVLEFIFMPNQFPLSLSKLIDNGNSLDPASENENACQMNDSRGISRPQFGGFINQCDIGAYELDGVIFRDEFEGLD